MIRFNKIRRLGAALAALAAVGAMTFAGCTEVDDTLGSNLVPDNQQMKAGYMTLPGREEVRLKKYIETRLFQTDSIIGSNISYGYMGSTLNDTLGLRQAGFLSQYLCYYKVDEGYFGYRPIFDSAQLLLSIDTYGGDTTTVQQFSIFEVIDNKYLTEKEKKDTTFYLGYNPEEAGIIGEELFTFELGGDKGPATTAVTLTPREAGRNFIKRLMLQKGSGTTYEEDYSIYSADNLEKWVEEFKGLYIRPTDQQPAGKGAVYATKLDASGLAVYGRNRVESDPTLIKDTIGMVYYFYDQYADHGNVSLNHVTHDYAQATDANVRIDIDAAREPAEGETDNRPENPLVYVEGMGGVVTELKFTQEFFDALEAEIDRENDASGKRFSTLAFSQARMLIYFPESNYDWTQIGQGNTTRLIEQMDAAQSRLGLYTDYKKLTPIADYAYVYEKNYSITLSYGGYINRSRGCYILDITGYMQALWNSYDKERKAADAEHRAVDLDRVEHRTVYLGPEAYSLYTPDFSVLQGAATEASDPVQNNAPIRFELAYNMIK